MELEKTARADRYRPGRLICQQRKPELTGVWLPILNGLIPQVNVKCLRFTAEAYLSSVVFADYRLKWSCRTDPQPSMNVFAKAMSRACLAMNGHIGVNDLLKEPYGLFIGSLWRC